MRVMIGSNCFGTVREFELNGLKELESVVIGQKSFTYAKTDSAVSSSKRTDGSYRILNCPKLTLIQVGDYSFSDYYQSFELHNLPSLQSISIDQKNCFYWTASVSLTSEMK